MRLLLLQVLFFGPSTDPMKISIAVYFHFAFNGALQTLPVHSGTLLTLMHSTGAHVQWCRRPCKLPTATYTVACCKLLCACAAAFEDGDRAGPIRHDLYMLVRAKPSLGRNQCKDTIASTLCAYDGTQAAVPGFARSAALPATCHAVRHTHSRCSRRRTQDVFLACRG